MAYVDYAYYKDGYLLGKAPAVPDKEFMFWERLAEKEIDTYTYNRIRRNTSLISVEVKECTCAIAELLYKADMLAENGLKEGMAGAMTSYSNDGQSGTFDVSQSVYTETGKRNEVKRLVNLYLGRTGLLYAGGVCIGEPKL